MMLIDFQNHINAQFPFLKGKKILLAVSGGLDSMVLLNLFHKLDYTVGVAHANFKLRGADSEADEAFVEVQTSKYKYPFYSTFLDTQVPKLSTQMAARQLRYEWFEKLMKIEKYDWLATAHHADDQVETMLLNLGRGTGLAGVSGIPSVHGKILRPLLPFRKSLLLAYAQKNDLSWREDSSNSKTTYDRNFIRLEILPKFEARFPNFVENSVQSANFLQDALFFQNQHIEALRQQLFKSVQGGVEVKVEALLHLKPRLSSLHLLFYPFGFESGNELEKLLWAPASKQLVSDQYRLERFADKLFLSQRLEHPTTNEVFEVGNQGISDPITLKIFATDVTESSGRSVTFDKKKIVFPLQLRKWISSDVFYPQGMNGQKKVSKFLRELKLSPFEKAQQWVLVSDQKVVWILGRRGDARFVADENTKEKINIQWH